MCGIIGIAQTHLVRERAWLVALRFLFIGPHFCRRITSAGLRRDGWSVMSLWRQNKGQNACVAALIAALRKQRDSPVPIEELLEASWITVALGQAARR